MAQRQSRMCKSGLREANELLPMYIKDVRIGYIYDDLNKTCDINHSFNTIRKTLAREKK